MKKYNIEPQHVFHTWEDIFKVPRFADAVIITTPDRLHYGPAMAALEMGYDPPSQAQGADETATVTIGGFPILGKPDAPLTMVLFTDYQCPYCSKFETQTLPEIKRQYIDTGKLRFVVRDLPLAFHPNAAKAAEATYCAEDQGKFWELREKLVTHTGRLEEKNLSEYAEKIGLDPAKFNACLTGGRHGEKVKQSQAEAATQKITGTPTFVVGRTAGDKVSGVRVVGAQPFASFDQKLKDMLKAIGK